MGREPSSLFLYGDASAAARGVREAIYDGPFDLLNFSLQPVILERVPSMANGDARVEPVEVKAGDLIVGADGNLTNLAEGTIYYPSGCREANCAAAYSGSEPARLDQLIVRYSLLPNLQWSDGAPLSADDSQYSYEIAKSLFPQVLPDLIARTQSYQALDDVSVEWRGLPGYQDAGYATFFFPPLPRHAWGHLALDALLTSELTNRMPLGWGPYTVEEWTVGDHITLTRNPVYFRAAEGLPLFDRLVFRFPGSAEDALAALQVGECDYIDATAGLEAWGEQLMSLQSAGQAAVEVEIGTAWEHLDFGIVPIDPAQPALFGLAETRQAVAMCLDRQRMADELFFTPSLVPDTYLPPSHPLYNAEARQYTFDPGAASTLLESVGWRDVDGDPATPRAAFGVPGVPDGTPFEFNFLTTADAEKQQAAEIIVSSLAQCGIQANQQTMPWAELLAPGPEGPVFGRSFQMAQFGWMTAREPSCFLYTSQEIPGPYPEYAKGWGGANVSGFSSPEYDQACQGAQSALPDSPAYPAFHEQAQSIFAEELPAVPLYLRLKVAAMRPDFCGAQVQPAAESGLWNLEQFDYGEGCK